MSSTPTVVQIQFLYAPGSSLVDGVRAALQAGICQVGALARIEEIAGDYPSPAVLVNGVDVTGCPSEDGDLPTGEQIVAALAAASPVMTIGRLARRSGVPVKALREYEDLGLIYTLGRSAGNYRLFGEEALWCVGNITGLRALGLTVAEISDFTRDYLSDPGATAGPRLAGMLKAVRRRTEERVAQLQQLLARIDAFEDEHAADLEGRGDLHHQDPRFQTRS